MDKNIKTLGVFCTVVVTCTCTCTCTCRRIICIYSAPRGASRMIFVRKFPAGLGADDDRRSEALYGARVPENVCHTTYEDR